jgi:hypothetical protein
VDLASLAIQLVSGAVGGAVLMAIVGFVRQKMGGKI